MGKPWWDGCVRHWKIPAGSPCRRHSAVFLSPPVKRDHKTPWKSSFPRPLVNLSPPQAESSKSLYEAVADMLMLLRYLVKMLRGRMALKCFVEERHG